MPWLATEVTPTAKGTPAEVPVGVAGSMKWFRPDADVTGVTHAVPIPSGLHAVNQQVSWSDDGQGAYALGGYSDNAVLTRHCQLWPMSIRAPNATPDVALAAGPGITASVICYLRWFDSLTDERSPLSGPSATLAAANQKITYANLNLQEAPERATHIEAWESRDGGLPRLVFRRDIGVVTVTHAKALGDLGEAETSTWTKPPRCRFGAMWHDRFVMAGDDQNPTTIYLMMIGFPERWEGLSVDMKSRQAITGLTEINGKLLVFGATVTEAVSGWTEDDIRIDIEQPKKGLISHFSIAHMDTYIMFLAQEQPYLCDGSSWFPMGKDIKPVYAADLRNNRQAFQQCFVDHHPDEHLVRWYLGGGQNLKDYRDFPADDRAGFVFMVADYEPVLPLEGGGFAQPRWSYDWSQTGRSCAALMAVPGGSRADPFLGGVTNGAIFRDALPTIEDPSGGDTDASGNANDNIMDILTGALQYGQLGGPEDHGMQVTDLSLIWDQGGTVLDDGDDDLTKHDLPWTVRLYAGDIACAGPPFKVTPPSADAGEVAAQDVPAFKYDALQVDLPVLVDVPNNEYYRLQRENTHHFGNIQGVVGRAFKLRLTMANPQQANLSGFTLLWSPAKATRENGKRWPKPGT